MNILLLALACTTGEADLQNKLSEPFRITAGGGYLSVLGHADPLYVDFDNDGTKDLLVGDGRGRLRIYKNHGNEGHPAFKDYQLFEAGGKVGKVPCW